MYFEYFPRDLRNRSHRVAGVPCRVGQGDAVHTKRSLMMTCCFVFMNRFYICMSRFVDMRYASVPSCPCLTFTSAHMTPKKYCVRYCVLHSYMSTMPCSPVLRKRQRFLRLCKRGKVLFCWWPVASYRVISEDKLVSAR